MIVWFLAFSSGGRTLRLTHTSVADEGQYTCVVTNAAGEARKDFDLSVLGKYVVIFVTVKKIRGSTVYFAGILKIILPKHMSVDKIKKCI